MADRMRAQAAEAPWEVQKEKSPWKPGSRLDTCLAPKTVKRNDSSLHRASTALAHPEAAPPRRRQSGGPPVSFTTPCYAPPPRPTTPTLASALPFSPRASRSTSLSLALPPLGDAAASDVAISTFQRHEARPQPLSQEMEGSGVGLLAAPAPAHVATPASYDDVFAESVNEDMSEPVNENVHETPQSAANFTMPFPNANMSEKVEDMDMSRMSPGLRLQSPFEPTNNVNQTEGAGETATQLPAWENTNRAEQSLATLDPPIDTLDAPLDLPYDATAPDPFDPLPSEDPNNLFWGAADSMPPPSEPERPNPAEMKGFAQLVFPDGEFLLTSTEVVLGRNEDFAKKFRREQVRKDRLAQEQAAAQEALSQYRQEPSQHDGEPSSKEDQSLEGRPARALASAYSEQGGIVSFNDADEEAKRKKKSKKRRHQLLSGQSSSTTSVVPANLHTFASIDADQDDEDDVNRSVFLPVHPNSPGDIFRISKQHLRIFYDDAQKAWSLEVLGKAAFVQYAEQTLPEDEEMDEMVGSKIDRGDVVPLSHDTRVQVSSLAFWFKLPQANPASNSDSDSELSDAENPLASPARRLSNAMSAVSSDEEGDGVPLAQLTKQKRARKRKEKQQSKNAGKKSLTIKLKPPKPNAEVSPAKASKSPKKTSPPGATKTTEKGKRPQKTVQPEPEPETEKPEEIAQSVEPAPSETPAPTTENPTPSALPPEETLPQFEPGSMLADIGLDEMPEKRKGPGRPPKNGVVSKRDMGMVRRMQKEINKANLPMPPMHELVRRVRFENKQKEALAKAAARGEPPPPAPMMPGVPAQAVPHQSVEMSDAAIMSALTNHNNNTAIDPAIVNSTEDQHGSAVEGELKESPKRPRAYRSPSPMKPREECTEDELKKPNHTYYTTLDEILSEGPTEGLELQQIYDKICKKYPYYKYGVDGHGWQSSVRHNLKQHDRFQQVTKQGKGWLWAINHEIPFDKEKKRRPTPPPPVQRPPMPYHMQNGQVPPQQGVPGQFGGMGYAPQYGQPQNGQQGWNPQAQQPGNPQGQYSSPYGQPGQTGQSYGPPQTQPGAPAYGIPGSQPPNTQYPYAPPPQGQQPQYQPGPYAPQPPPPGQQRTSVPPQNRPTSTPPAAPANKPAFSNLVEEIMAYRATYLQPHARNQASEAYKFHEEVFRKCVDWISELQCNMRPSLDFGCEEERRVFGDLERVMRKYRDEEKDKAERAGQQGQGGQSGQQGQGQAQGQAPPQQPQNQAPAAGQQSQPQIQAPNQQSQPTSQFPGQPNQQNLSGQPNQPGQQTQQSQPAQQVQPTQPGQTQAQAQSQANFQAQMQSAQTAQANAQSQGQPPQLQAPQQEAQSQPPPNFPGQPSQTPPAGQQAQGQGYAPPPGQGQPANGQVYAGQAQTQGQPQVSTQAYPPAGLSQAQPVGPPPASTLGPPPASLSTQPQLQIPPVSAAGPAPAQSQAPSQAQAQNNVQPQQNPVSSVTPPSAPSGAAAPFHARAQASQQPQDAPGQSLAAATPAQQISGNGTGQTPLQEPSVPHQPSAPQPSSAAQPSPPAQAGDRTTSTESASKSNNGPSGMAFYPPYGPPVAGNPYRDAEVREKLKLDYAENPGGAKPSELPQQPAQHPDQQGVAQSQQQPIAAPSTAPANGSPPTPEPNGAATGTPQPAAPAPLPNSTAPSPSPLTPATPAAPAPPAPMAGVKRAASGELEREGNGGDGQGEGKREGEGSPVKKARLDEEGESGAGQ